MQSRQQSPGLSDEATTLRPTTPMSHAGSDFSRTTLMETAFRPLSPLYGIPQYRSAQSVASPNLHPGPNGPDQYDTENFWKPFTIRLPYLIFLNILTLSFIIIIETLYYISNRRDGLLFMKDIDDLPLGQYFTIQYLPTLIAVLYGIAWSIVDLDCKRLEPFYDLSKETGASSDALFLEYQYQFPLLVPFRAFFKRHWSVFLSSTIFLTTTLIVTPLQSSILATVDRTSELRAAFNITAQFLPINGSDSALTPEFLFTEYTISRLNGGLPGFTAEGDSFLPVIPSRAFQEDKFSLSTNWSLTNLFYTLDVNCVEPSFSNVTDVMVIGSELQDAFITYVVSYQFEENLCNVTNTLKIARENANITGPLDIAYGYHWRRPELISQWCGFKNTTTVATLGQFNKTDRKVKIKSTLCELRGVQEFQQNVVINATTHAILERKSAPIFRRYIQKEEIDLLPFDAALFNRGAQEVLGSDISVFANTKINAADTLFNGTIPKKAFLDGSVLQDTTKRTYKHFFSLAVSTSSAFFTRSNGTSVGKVIVRGQTVVIDRTFAIVSDIFLGLVLLMGIILCAYSYQRDSTLKSDPDSLSATMALIARSNLPSKFNGLDRASTKILKSNIGQSKVNIGYWEDPNSGGLVYKLDEIPDSQSQISLPRTSLKEESIPFHLRLNIGVLFFVTHLAIIGFLTFLFIQSRGSGLPRLSDNSFTFNLIWAFIPTLVATVLEPIWASINRDISVLQPFYNLIKRNVSAGRSLSLKYQTIPAVLMARSLVAHDFLLSVVSFVTVSVSLLAVTLPGIFFEDVRAVPTTMNFQPQATKPIIPIGFYFWGFNSRRDNNFLDSFAAARANISEHVPLPPWSTREHMFLPVKPAPELNSSLDFDFYRTTTLGFSGSMECRPVLNGTGGEYIYYNPNNGTTTAFLQIPNTYQGNPSDMLPCQTVFGYKPPVLRDESPAHHNSIVGRWPFPSLYNAGELYLDTSEDDTKLVHISAEKREYSWEEERQKYIREGFCLNIIPVAWSHRIYSRGAKGYVMEGQPKQTLLVCQPKVTVANFSIEVDRIGNIQSYRKLGNSSEIDDYLEPGFTKTQFNEHLSGISRSLLKIPESRAQDWEGLLMTRLAKNGTDYFDPVELGKLASETFALSFSIFAAQNKAELFLEGGKSSDNGYVSGTIFKYEKRVVMSPPLTIVSLAILGLFCGALVLVYVFRRKRYLPRQPTSLASMIAYCQDSTLLDDLVDTWGMSTVRRQEILEKLGHTYGFGWYKGRDGTRRLGVDKEPLLASYDIS
ncbi:hypothetical protein AOL_s00097g44 [Orbilia oligospora ATCC 24927]|uniref:Uncharacterized protein n=2 Tax=Orbilia oligospora TaxID=2813651 RepID=G1XI67_ARTOA|nr:hypothetical protein AOL_s00097g44 [Orbilia oligospora ATCC 24927]EGX46998.1 hypothetical protein AOL_s00097g44 [Orbilia oligospora ATCC 24927]KAF3277912.1 hypothetical protein TWF970_004791 [Orbilia oligospora]